MAGLALACLILGSVVSYAKARAEGLGMTANVGIAERADRLVAVLAATGLVGLGLPEILLTVVLRCWPSASLVTVVQRMLVVRRQALGRGVSALAERRRARPPTAPAGTSYAGCPAASPTARSTSSPTSPGAVAAPACGGCAATTRGSPRARPGRARRPRRARACAPTCATGATRSGCPTWACRELVQTIRTEGDGPVREQLATGRGAIMFLGHLGNWDTGGAWSTTQLAPVTTVAERLRPEELFEQFLAFRESLGMRIIPLTGGNDVFRELLAALRGGAFVALLADRDLTRGGVEVDLCGSPRGWRSGRPRSRWPPAPRCTRCRCSTSRPRACAAAGGTGSSSASTTGCRCRRRHHRARRSSR